VKWNVGSEKRFNDDDGIRRFLLSLRKKGQARCSRNLISSPFKLPCERRDHWHGGGYGGATDMTAVNNENLPTPMASSPADGVLGDSAGGNRPSWQWHRERLRRHILKHPIEGISEEELAAHFEGMPPRYWQSVTESELVWGLQNVHRFLHGNVTSASGDTAVVLNWRSFPFQGYTKVLVCTWDRLGLLTKLAGYVSALRLNILRAEVFTRSDNIVLDVFWLCEGENRHVADAERLRQLAFLVEGGLSEPPRFISEWACQSHQYHPPAASEEVVIHFNNDDSADHTIITVVASERLGLLHDMLKVLNQFPLNISEALIDTATDRVHDIFFVTDQNRQKVVDQERLQAIESDLRRVIG
jgi:[protein-PII] uridylyltransferase